MPLGFQCRHPGGMAENSPAFQRWDRGPGVSSPEGTAENRQLSRPCGTQPSIRPHPALKRRAIFKRPSGTKTRPPCGTYSSNPSGIGHSCSPVGREALGSVKVAESRGGQECPRSEKPEQPNFRAAHGMPLAFLENQVNYVIEVLGSVGSVTWMVTC